MKSAFDANVPKRKPRTRLATMLQDIEPAIVESETPAAVEVPAPPAAVEVPAKPAPVEAAAPTPARVQPPTPSPALLPGEEAACNR